MTEPSPWWRCNACDAQFAEPADWPGYSAQDRKILGDPERKIYPLKVCPRCH